MYVCVRMRVCVCVCVRMRVCVCRGRDTLSDISECDEMSQAFPTMLVYSNGPGNEEGTPHTVYLHSLLSSPYTRGLQ